MRVSFWLISAASMLANAPAQAAVYLSIEQAQALMFPHMTLTPAFVTLTAAQMQSIEHDSGVPVADTQVRAWQATDGGWFIVDQVYGKHQPIRYALALDAHGAIRQVEILEYLESRGGEIRLPAWRHQFDGKHHGDVVELNQSVRNISGATLSCAHVTDGIRRILSTYALVLAPAQARSSP